MRILVKANTLNLNIKLTELRFTFTHMRRQFDVQWWKYYSTFFLFKNTFSTKQSINPRYWRLTIFFIYLQESDEAETTGPATKSDKNAQNKEKESLVNSLCQPDVFKLPRKVQRGLSNQHAWVVY